MFVKRSSRVDNEVYGTVLNGHSLNTAWPESPRQNEIMFRLPTPLSTGDEIYGTLQRSLTVDTIEINGTLNSNPELLTINLTAGLGNQDYQNIPCQFEFNFSQDIFTLRSIFNGQIVKNNPTEWPNLVGQFPADNRFKIIIHVRGNGNNIYVDVSVFESNIGIIELDEASVKSISFLTLHGDDINEIEDLKFTFAKKM